MAHTHLAVLLPLMSSLYHCEKRVVFSEYLLTEQIFLKNQEYAWIVLKATIQAESRFDVGEFLLQIYIFPRDELALIIIVPKKIQIHNLDVLFGWGVTGGDVGLIAKQ